MPPEELKERFCEDEERTTLDAVPKSATGCGELLALSVMVSVPVRLPAVVGVKVTATVHRQAAAKLRELEDSEPDFSSPPAFLARIDLGEGNYLGYLAQLNRLAAISKSPANARLAEAAGRGWKVGGSEGMLRAMKIVQGQAFAKGESDGYDLAHTCALLGEKQEAVKYLQSAFAAKDIFVLDVLAPDWAHALDGYPPFESLQRQIRTRFGMA